MITKTYRHLKANIRRPIYYIPAIIVVILIATYIYKSGSASRSSHQVVIAPVDFVQKVAVTGKVVSAENVDLGFETSGRVAAVPIKVGDKVSKGQILASLSSGDAYGNVLQRQALVAAEQAKLAEVMRGSRPEDITLAETDVQSAKSSLEQSKQNIIDQIKDAFTRSDDAVRSKVDQMYKNPRTVTPEIIPFDNYTLQQSLNDQRLQIGDMLKAWSASTQTLTLDTYSDADLKVARANLSRMATFLDGISTAASGFAPNTSLSQATIDKYKTDASTARSNISLATSNLNTASQSLNSNTLAYQRSQQQLTLKKNGSTPEQIQTEQAQLQSAEAQLESAQAVLGKTAIRAPFSGVVTKADIKEGEIASPNTPVISLISVARYQIESYVSETDVSKVRVGQTAKVTLDAYGKDVFFDVVVTEVDPAETKIDGVSTYKTKFQFAAADDRVKSGMTANITIATETKPQSIVVPQQAITTGNQYKSVKLLQNGKEVERTVVTGGIDQSGGVLVTSGLSAGDIIVVPNE